MTERGTRGVKVRRHSPESNRREEILAAIVRTVVEEGIDGLTVQRVADRAGVSQGLVMYYFKTRDEMIFSAWTAAVENVTQRIYLGPDEPVGLQKLRAMFRVNFADRGEDTPPWSFWLNLWAKVSTTPDLQEKHEAISATRRAGFINIVQSAIDRGEIRPEVDASLAGDLFYALLYGLAVKVTLDPHQVSPGRALEIMELVLRLASRETASDTSAEP